MGFERFAGNASEKDKVIENPNGVGFAKFAPPPVVNVPASVDKTQDIESRRISNQLRLPTPQIISDTVKKTPVSAVKNLGGVPIGADIIQPYKEDSLPLKVGKGIVNYGLGTAGRAVNAPLELAANTVNALTAPGKPKEYISTPDQVFPKTGQQKFEQFKENNPVLGGIAENVLYDVVNPLTYLSGGIASDLAKAKNLVKPAAGQMLKPNPKMPNNLVPDIPKQPEIKTDFYADPFGNVQNRNQFGQFLLPEGRPAIDLKPKTFTRSQTALKQAEDALTEGIEALENHVQHNDILAAYPPGTGVEAALADAQRATGVNIKQLLDNYEQISNTINTPISDLPKTGLDRLKLANVSGVRDIPGIVRSLDPVRTRMFHEASNPRPLDFRKTVFAKPEGKFSPPKPSAPEDFLRPLSDAMKPNKGSGIATANLPGKFELTLDDLQAGKLPKAKNDLGALRTKKEPEVMAAKIEKPATFKVNTDTGAKAIDSTKITDGQGKALSQAMDTDHKELYDAIVKDLEGAQVRPDPAVQDMAWRIKDRSGFSYNIKDVYRNFRQAFGNGFGYVKTKYLDPLDNAKKSYVDMQQQYTDGLYDNIVKKFNIQKGSKESAAVQWYGEGKKVIGHDDLIEVKTGRKVKKPRVEQYTYKNLVNDFGQQKADKIVQADKWFREMYNNLIDQVNASRKQIYPSNPGKLVPYRDDYYRHFQEMSEGFEGVKNLFETPSQIDPGLGGIKDLAEGFMGIKNLLETPSQIDPSLAGISEWTKPRSKFAGFMQRRGFGPYKADAVGGFLDYIKAASYATHIDPQISVFRGLAKDIAEGTAESRNANGFIKYLTEFANDLAGKTNPADRFIQDNIPGGRTTFRAINWANSRVKANTVVGNLSSTLAQIANVPQGIAYVKNPVHLTKGAGDMLASIFGAGKHAKLYKQSQFVSERYLPKMYTRFDTKMLDQPKKFASWMLGVLDEVGTKFIWSSTYNKAAAEGIANPIKYADDVARRLVAGRGVGEMPLLQKSKLVQLVAPFQVEVGNLWHVMKDFVSAKDFSGLAMLFAADYILNKGMEQVRGSGVVFDPINAIVEALAEEDITPLERGGRLFGEVLSNVPGGQTLAAMYPEYGTDKLPTRKELFGREDPTRFGSGLLVTKGLQDPLYKLLPSFGGAQIKKTLGGLDAIKEKGVYDKDGNQLKYPVATDPVNAAKGLLFGPGALRETDPYYKNDRRPLSEKQTQTFQAMTGKGYSPQAVYDIQMKTREVEATKDKIREILKDTGLTDEQKKQKLAPLLAEGRKTAAMRQALIEMLKEGR